MQWSTPPPGLCEACRHVRRIVTERGATFTLCERSRHDGRYPKYPRLPVVYCPGFTPTADPAAGAGDADTTT